MSAASPAGKPDEAPRIFDTAEGRRLLAARADGAWKDWGPYLSDRQWGTVREDYSPDGEAWDYFPHDHARARAYRWGEDAIGGFGEKQLRWCLGVALWNGRDPILKERLFGLTNAEGNHGEDVKELYYHLDATPTHSFNRMLYKYPQGAFPYADLVEENGRRGPEQGEYELIDTGALDGNRYFDVFVEYAKGSPDDVLMRVRVLNRGPDDAALHLLPQLWARNSWSWSGGTRPELRATGDRTVSACRDGLPDMALAVEDGAELLFCDNDTNAPRLFGTGDTGFFKDAIDRFVVHGERDAVNPARTGTKCAVLHRLEVPAGGERVVRLRFRRADATADAFADFDAVFREREAEADAFYAALQAPIPDPDTRLVQRQALAGMLWSKQYYEYDVKRWLDGDPDEPAPPASRRKGRNRDWIDFDIAAIISMPDKWEYPWFASWDLALQTAVLALVDPDFAKDQVLLLLREGRMHPNAALPAYEWSFGDANPPLHAWAAWRVFEMDRTLAGEGDHDFLKRVFNKLTMNFTWWVNRKDANGRNIFQGGFLGLDNIAIFDRSAGELPTGGTLSQSDGTAWMAMYALAMLRIAVELAQRDPSYQDIAAKFAEHFLVIAGAEGNALWDEEDGFFYDILSLPSGEQVPLRTRTMVGLIPLYAVAAFDMSDFDALPEFKARMEAFLARRPDLTRLAAVPDKAGNTGNALMALLRTHRLGRILGRVLDEEEFLSPHGLRAVSKFHEAEPYRFEWQNKTFELPYWPAEGRSRLFGGNSNWRGPVWMPVNYLLIESLLRFDRFYDGGYKVAFPTRSDRQLTLREVAGELAQRLVGLYRRGDDGTRAVHGTDARLQQDPHFRDLVLFYEYYHGDTGRGVGASHQCGWSGLVALLIHNLHWNGPQALPKPASAP